MSNPDVDILNGQRRNVSVLCPITGCGLYIPRDKSAWIAHFEYYHRAEHATWATPPVLSGQMGKVDSKYGRTIYEFGHNCFGCGATFMTEAELEAHMVSAHIDVSVIS